MSLPALGLQGGVLGAQEENECQAGGGTSECLPADRMVDKSHDDLVLCVERLIEISYQHLFMMAMQHSSEAVGTTLLPGSTPCFGV